MQAEYLEHRDGTKFVPITSQEAVIDSEGKNLATNLAKKVDKIQGKGLSSNDYSDADKAKLDGINLSNYATKSDINNLEKIDILENDVVSFDAADILIGGLGGSDNKTIGNLLNEKVDKVEGKGLSANDFDNTAKDITDKFYLSGLCFDERYMKVTGTDTDVYETINSIKSGKIPVISCYAAGNGDNHIVVSGCEDNITFEHNGCLVIAKFVETIRGQYGIDTTVINPVNKETGKGLSSNDYTNADKSKLDGIDLSNYATKSDLTDLDQKCGDLSELETSDKTSLVGAVNEANSKASGKYSKPTDGIPSTDLASAVQTSLGKADSALQSHQDISGKQNKPTTTSAYPADGNVASNTIYNLGELTSLAINNSASVTDETLIFFSVGETACEVAVTKPYDVVGEIKTTESGKYVISILNGVIVCGSISNVTE